MLLKILAVRKCQTPEQKALYIASFEVIQGAFKILTLLKIYVIIYLA